MNEKKLYRIVVVLCMVIFVIGCGKTEKGIVGDDWVFTRMIIDGKDSTQTILDNSDEKPTLKCTETEYELTLFGDPLKGTWVETSENNYELTADGDNKAGMFVKITKRDDGTQDLYIYTHPDTGMDMKMWFMR